MCNLNKDVVGSDNEIVVRTNKLKDKRQRGIVTRSYRYRGSSLPLLYKIIAIYAVLLLVLVSVGRHFVSERGLEIQDSLPIMDLKVSLVEKMVTNRARLQLMRNKLVEAEWRAHNRRYQVLLDQINEKIDFYDMSIDEIKQVNTLGSFSNEEMKVRRAALYESLRSELEYESTLDKYQLLVLELMLSADKLNNDKHIAPPGNN
ncbi:hypothetical protein [Vibrio nigripulchritudo]|uniref:hypothetical protein n=2 Tax=Vibrio TaxID=662 RepID=UPI0024905430|nr:hypothetical protein [Vibrio nigripulchritudo]